MKSVRKQIEEQIEETYKSGYVVRATIKDDLGTWTITRVHKTPDTAAYWYVSNHPSVQKIEVCALTRSRRAVHNDVDDLVVLHRVFIAEAHLQGLYAEEMERQDPVISWEAQGRQLSYEAEIEALENL